MSGSKLWLRGCENALVNIDVSAHTIHDKRRDLLVPTDHDTIVGVA
jgi:hypothetical protein